MWLDEIIGPTASCRKEPNLDHIDPRARLCAVNNADIYALVFRAHSLTFRRDATAFASAADPPPYYGNLLTLDPNATVSQREQVLALKSVRSSVGVKDGFHCLHLEADGFDLLFRANWVWAPAGRVPLTEGWRRVKSADALSQWEEAWKAGGSPADRRVFPTSLLAESRIAFLGLPGGTGYRAGCIANWSDGCIGISNVFGKDLGVPPQAAAAGAVAKLSQGNPIVGYERGAALEDLLACDFETVGDLRVWVSSPQST